MIKRYNFGFGFCGPLEQAKEGKFCKAEEVLDLLQEKDRVIDNLDGNCNHSQAGLAKLRKRNQFLASQVEDLSKIEENYKKLKKEIKFNRRLIRICGLAIGFLIGKLVLDNF